MNEMGEFRANVVRQRRSLAFVPAALEGMYQKAWQIGSVFIFRNGVRLPIVDPSRREGIISLPSD
jgi:hypothetical protein